MSTMSIAHSKGEYRKSGRVDPYLRAYFSGIAHRKSCNACKFKGRARYSDLTLFDCARFSELTSKMDNDKGYTNVAVNSDKGMKLLSLLDDSRVRCVEINRLDSENLCGKMIEKSTPRHCCTDSFYADITTQPVSQVVQRYLPINTLDYVIENCKGIAHVLGISQIVKRLKQG